MNVPCQAFMNGQYRYLNRTGMCNVLFIICNAYYNHAGCVKMFPIIFCLRDRDRRHQEAAESLAGFLHHDGPRMVGKEGGGHDRRPHPTTAGLRLRA